MRTADFEALIATELDYFDSDEQREAFSSFQIEPVRITQTWQYNDETPTCYIIARSKELQIVYCSSGLGPSFPWSAQRLGTMDLGMDGEWNAYLYESFAGSQLCQGQSRLISSSWVLVSAQRHNKRIEFARVACPTRYGDAPSLAAHSRR